MFTTLISSNSLAILLSCINSTPAVAQVGRPAAALSSAQAEPQTVMLVVDTSGSMAGKRLEQAKQALTTTVDRLGPSQPAGLRSYAGECGNRGPLRVPIGAENREVLRDAIASLTAGGGTPTPDALLGAAADLAGVAGPRTVVLISDGESTCGDPCPVAETIKNQQGIDFKVHTVGFQAPEAAEGELACIARVTGGRYVPADGVEGLSQAIGSATGGANDCGLPSVDDLLQPFIDVLAPLRGLVQPYIDPVQDALTRIPDPCTFLPPLPPSPPTQSTPPTVTPRTGERITANGPTLLLEIQAGSSESTDLISVTLDPPPGMGGPQLDSYLVGTNRDAGTWFEFKEVIPGSELTVSIYNRDTGYGFKTGPSDRNPDKIEHAAVRHYPEARYTSVSLEDAYEGGDKDFDDAVLGVFGNITVAPASGPVVQQCPTASSVSNKTEFVLRHTTSDEDFSVRSIGPCSTGTLRLRLSDRTGSLSSAFGVRVNGELKYCSPALFSAIPAECTFTNARTFGSDVYRIQISQTPWPAGEFKPGYGSLGTGGFIVTVAEEIRL